MARIAPRSGQRFAAPDERRSNESSARVSTSPELHHVIIVTPWINRTSTKFIKLFLRCDAVTNLTRSAVPFAPSRATLTSSAQVPNVKLRPAPLQPRTARAHDPDASCDRSSDSEAPPNASMVDLCPRPFRGFSICATGTMDKVRHTTLFRCPLSSISFSLPCSKWHSSSVPLPRATLPTASPISSRARMVEPSTWCVSLHCRPCSSLKRAVCARAQDTYHDSRLGRRGTCYMVTR